MPMYQTKAIKQSRNHFQVTSCEQSVTSCREDLLHLSLFFQRAVEHITPSTTTIITIIILKITIMHSAAGNGCRCTLTLCGARMGHSGFRTTN